MALMRAEFATPILMRLMAFWNFEVQQSIVMTSRNRARIFGLIEKIHLIW